VRKRLNEYLGCFVDHRCSSFPNGQGATGRVALGAQYRRPAISAASIFPFARSHWQILKQPFVFQPILDVRQACSPPPDVNAQLVCVPARQLTVDPNAALPALGVIYLA
jgi:hypothetical protein